MEITRDWECEGALRIEGGAKTLKRYRELHESTWNLPVHEWGIFFAFSDKQFLEGKAKAKIKEGEKIYNYGSGVFGTHEGMKRYMAELEAVNDKIKAECDPQEVYVEEYNNHECMLDWDGDDRAIELIIDLFGVEVAKTVKRFSVHHTVDEIIQEQEERYKKRKESQS